MDDYLYQSVKEKRAFYRFMGKPTQEEGLEKMYELKNVNLSSFIDVLNKSNSQINMASILKDPKLTSIQEYDSIIKTSSEVPPKTYPKTEMTNLLNKNIAVQELQKSFIPPTILNSMTLNGNVDNIKEQTQRNILNIRSKTIDSESLNTDNITKLREINSSLDDIFNNTTVFRDKIENSNLEPEIKDLFKRVRSERRWESQTLNNWWSATLDFFKLFSVNKRNDTKVIDNRLNIDDMKYFLQAINYNKKMSDYSPKFSLNFQNNFSQAIASNADNELDNKLNSIA